MGFIQLSKRGETSVRLSRGGVGRVLLMGTILFFYDPSQRCASGFRDVEKDDGVVPEAASRFRPFYELKR